VNESEVKTQLSFTGLNNGFYTDEADSKYLHKKGIKILIPAKQK
jgi:hypothetical protein